MTRYFIKETQGERFRTFSRLAYRLSLYEVYCRIMKWCSSPESAVQCGVLKQCHHANLTKARQAGEPVQLDVYYESLCPDCILYLTRVLYPTWVLLQDILSVHLVPFGNAQTLDVFGQ
ncbi:gamma-interferon-inducible lysosomal thiol reductase-like [Syngnathus typhle]|uniref:gamma-interferon-inducible lysosomal thiol reductase-like n=1 Tax=Syngnathus typhle TaxID=161592 RepID=UPI002A6A1125|nr:gamma-interferon-inducible lysosomal thiol reductase-like [Syngnathus typhle]